MAQVYLTSDFDDNVSWHSFSTAQSVGEAELDWNDIAGMPWQEHGEYIYMLHRYHKARWRKFAHRRHRAKGKGRKGKRKGSSKGKGHAQGKGWENHRSFLAEVSWDPQIMNHIYMKGGSGNPIGKDGQRMLCSICKSPDHFRA